MNSQLAKFAAAVCSGALVSTIRIRSVSDPLGP
jgi:hypothetical protein